jgi:hypothetical protein
MRGPVLAGVVSALMATASSGFALFRFRWSVDMLNLWKDDNAFNCDCCIVDNFFLDTLLP